MEEEKNQKELFEFEPPRKPFPVFGSIFQKANLENKFAVTVTMERLVFIAIGIIMLMVIVYAVGVEAGKSSLGARPSRVDVVTAEPNMAGANTPSMAVKVPVIALGQPAKTVLPAKTTAAQSVTQAKTSDLRAQQPATPELNKPYTISAGSFRNKDSAIREMSNLKRMGINSFLKQNGDLYVVCVGAYSDKTSMLSKKALAKVRQVRSDAYFILK